MSSTAPTKIRLVEQEEGAKIRHASPPFATLFDSQHISVGLYAPGSLDTQSPHDRDELYIVSSGSGFFRCDEEVVPFATGDLLFARSGAEHRFERFGEDFRTWVIFFGPKRA